MSNRRSIILFGKGVMLPMRQSPKFSIWSSLPVLVGSGDIREAASMERMVAVSEEPAQERNIKGNIRKQLPRS
ncbi:MULTISPECIES: hypothetical protein [Paenibacillus]|nr:MULTISPECIES: hypothetical protein [Paenibacillus]MDH6673981.1 hypothetical protein [Paenibacillus sp. LBL]MPY20929.1 hypothetical protein [Paenibacillus glucanolyticus]